MLYARMLGVIRPVDEAAGCSAKCECPSNSDSTYCIQTICILNDLSFQCIRSTPFTEGNVAACVEDILNYMLFQFNAPQKTLCLSHSVCRLIKQFMVTNIMHPSNCLCQERISTFFECDFPSHLSYPFHVVEIVTCRVFTEN